MEVVDGDYLSKNNIPVIDENGRFIVTDFGISKKLEFHMQTLRSVKMESSGTIAYMSPERLKTPPVVVMASDMWSLGMSVYELVTGQVLWDLGGLMQLGGTEIPSLGGNYSSHLTRFFQRCLAVNPWERPKAHEAHEEAKAKLKGEVYQHPLVQSSLTASKTSLTSSSLQNSYSLNRETSSRSYTYSSYNRLDITKQKPDWWKKYGNILKWGGGAVLLFILALGVFLLLFSLDHDNQNDLNEVVPSNIEPTLGDSIFVDTLVVDSVVKPTQKSIRPAYRIKPKPVSVPSPKQTINREEELWKKCKSEDNVFLYDRYMNEYPKGKHVKEAQKRIQQLESILIGR
jgi:serine/threonine protein kinase